MGLLSSLFGGSNKKTEAIKNAIDNGAMIVDVRSPAEFASGHAPGSINIPTGQFQSKLGKMKKAPSVVLCCRSGARAGSVQGLLKGSGVDSINAGPWQNVVKAQKV